MDFSKLVVPEDLSFGVDDSITLDERELQIPLNLSEVGVTNDNKVERLNFKVPAVFDGVNDLSTFTWWVNYRNALGYDNLYHVDDLKKEGDYLTFSWLTDENLYAESGDAHFSLRAVHEDGRAFGTKVATLRVAKGLNTASTIYEHDYDFINQYFSELDGIKKEVEAGVSQIDSVKADAESAKQSAESAKQSAESGVLNYSNSLKRNVLGKEIYATNVSPNKHLVKCLVNGKNLAHDVKNIYPDGSFRIIENSDMYSVVISYNSNYNYVATAIDGGFMRIGFTKEYPKDETILIKVDGQPFLDFKEGENLIKKSAELSEAKYMIVCYCRKSQSTNTPGKCFNALQVEIGNKATPYEPWIDPTTITVIQKSSKGTQTFTPNADGIVEGMYSVCPSFSVESSNFEANIQLEYNLDINVLDEKIEQISSKSNKPILAKKINGLIIDDGRIKIVDSEYWKVYAYDVMSNTEYTVNTLCSGFSSKRVLIATVNIPSQDIKLGDITDNVVEAKSMSKLDVACYVSETIKTNEQVKSMIVTVSNEKLTKTNEPIIDINGIESDVPTLSMRNVILDNAIENGDSITFKGGKNYVLHTELKRERSKRTNSILTIVSKSKISNSKVPMIQAKYNNVYASTRYALENTEEFETHQFRFPAFKDVNNSYTLHLYVPTGCELEVSDINISYSNMRVPYKNGVRLSSHLGFYFLAPENTMPAFQASVDAGYPSIICNPKVTKDGVFVCCHDDDIRRTARNMDGSEIKTPVLISNSTYEELLQYDFGIAFNKKYKGTKIPKLEDYFRLCARANVEPVWSTHYAFTLEQFKELKFMMQRYGVLKSFTMKGELPVLEAGYDVFGDDIKGYVFDVSENKSDEFIQQLKASKLANSKTDICIEFATSSNFTEETCRKVIEAGYRMGVWDVFETFGDTYNKWIRWGVTEITDDANCSFGLNW